MITGQLRSKIDKLWEEFWTGGTIDPLTVIDIPHISLSVKMTRAKYWELLLNAIYQLGC